jgi:hypothetical protein
MNDCCHCKDQTSLKKSRNSVKNKQTNKTIDKINKSNDRSSTIKVSPFDRGLVYYKKDLCFNFQKSNYPWIKVKTYKIDLSTNMKMPIYKIENTK